MDDRLLAPLPGTVLATTVVFLGLALLLVRRRATSPRPASLEVELTAVCCELRGLTSYAEAIPSRVVDDLLDDFHRRVDAVAAELGGSVTRVAADRVLVVVGVPAPREDHAQVGLALGRRVLVVGRDVASRWATAPHPLGVAVGVASGASAAAGPRARDCASEEALGNAAGTAARLGSAALDGEVLVNDRTARLCRASDLEVRAPRLLLGSPAHQPVYALV